MQAFVECRSLFLKCFLFRYAVSGPSSQNLCEILDSVKERAQSRWCKVTSQIFCDSTRHLWIVCKIRYVPVGNWNSRIGRILLIWPWRGNWSQRLLAGDEDLGDWYHSSPGGLVSVYNFMYRVSIKGSVWLWVRGDRCFLVSMHRLAWRLLQFTTSMGGNVELSSKAENTYSAYMRLFAAVLFLRTKHRKLESKWALVGNGVHKWWQHPCNGMLYSFS